MSFYPLLKAPGCLGWTTLCNFAPNNWEYQDISEKLVNVTWVEGNVWRSRNIGFLREDTMRTVDCTEMADFMSTDTLALLSLTEQKLPEYSETLPVVNSPTVMPAWRASLGLSTSHTSTCYQGEIDPFPAPGTLLTFCPFLQFGDHVENYLLLLNIEKSPLPRKSVLEIYDADKTELKAAFDINNNSATILCLGNLGFNADDLILSICREMCAIPLYLSKTSDGSFISIEHTHPPASFVIHGKRWGIQKILKDLWFSKTAGK